MPPSAEILEKISHFEQKLTKLETLVGEGPNEGLRSDVAAIRTEVTALRHFVTKHFYLALGGGAVIFWILNTVSGLK